MVELVKQNFRYNKQLYKKTEKELQTILNPNTPINHVGSTAIPNMYGKNIIDILVGAKNENEFNLYKEKITNLGYYPGKNNSRIYQFFASKETETGANDIHIHLSIIGTNRYTEFIILRDYLLKNKNEALAYSNLKKKLISKGIKDRNNYRTQKSEYVSKLIERAKNSLLN